MPGIEVLDDDDRGRKIFGQPGQDAPQRGEPSGGRRHGDDVVGGVTRLGCHQGTAHGVIGRFAAVPVTPIALVPAWGHCDTLVG